MIERALCRWHLQSCERCEGLFAPEELTDLYEGGLELYCAGCALHLHASQTEDRELDSTE